MGLYIAAPARYATAGQRSISTDRPTRRRTGGGGRRPVPRESLEHDQAIDHDPARSSPGAGDRRARLGVTLRSLTPQLADYFALGERGGALVASVLDDSPADAAGVRAGDVLLSVDGREVASPADAAAAVARASGDVEVRILRRCEERMLTARRAGPEEPGER